MAAIPDGMLVEIDLHRAPVGRDPAAQELIAAAAVVPPTGPTAKRREKATPFSPLAVGNPDESASQK